MCVVLAPSPLQLPSDRNTLRTCPAELRCSYLRYASGCCTRLHNLQLFPHHATETFLQLIERSSKFCPISSVCCGTAVQIMLKVLSTISLMMSRASCDCTPRAKFTYLCCGSNFHHQVGRNTFRRSSPVASPVSRTSRYRHSQLAKT